MRYGNSIHKTSVKKKLAKFLLILVVLCMFMSGCGMRESSYDESREENQVYQEWNEDIPYKLFKGSSEEVDVIFNSKLAVNEEKVRSEASLYLDPDAAELTFEERDTKWVKCLATLSLPENSEYTVADLAFMCYLGRYPNTVFGSEYFDVGETGKSASTENVAITFKVSKNLRSCQAVVYACIPCNDESYVLEIAKCIGGSRNIKAPILPDDSVLCWNISKGYNNKEKSIDKKCKLAF